MKASVWAALNSIIQSDQPTEQDTWLLAPADMPLLDAQSIDKVLIAHDVSRPSIITPIVGDRRGHPVLFPWRLASEVAKLGEREGVNALLIRHLVRDLPLDEPGCLRDLDTTKDFEGLSE